MFITIIFFVAGSLTFWNRSRILAPTLEYLLSRSAMTIVSNLAEKNVSFVDDTFPRVKLPANDQMILLLLDAEGRLLAQNQSIYPEQSAFKGATDVEQARQKGTGLVIGDVVWFSYSFIEGNRNYILRMGFTNIPWSNIDRDSYIHLVLFFLMLLFGFLILSYIFIFPYFRDIKKFGTMLSSLNSDNPKLMAHEYLTNEINEFSKKLYLLAESFKDKIAELRRKNMEVETLLSGMTEGVIVIDERLFIQRINPAAKDLFQIKELPSPQPYLLEVTHSSALLSVAENILWNRVVLETEIITNEGKKIHVRGNIVEGSHHKQLVLLVLDDITELQRLEEIRKDFVANVSHELKTPVTVIKGYIETILGGKNKKEDRRRFLKIIRDNADRMANIIEDLLTLSRLEKDHSADGAEEFDLIATITEAIHLYEHEANKKKIAIDFENPQLGAFARGHQRLALQALGNIISNAIKYSGENTRIQVNYLQRDHYHVIEVVDQGIGIPHKDLDRIFERFYRVDKSRSRDMGGTGLGLSIVKHIMALHGGKVEVLSTLGSGSKFILYFPR